MDKTARSLLKQAEETMGRQNGVISKLREENVELTGFKLAYDVATAMLAKEQIDESVFQETVEQLRGRPLDDLHKRAAILAVADPSKDLTLGDVDNRLNAGDKSASPESPTQTSEVTPSAQATEIGRSIIDNVINQ